MSRSWFGAKIYGIGIGPKGLRGWAATTIYCALMIGVPIARHLLHLSDWVIPIADILFTVAFVSLLFIKSDGEPWRWRWGRDQ